MAGVSGEKKFCSQIFESMEFPAMNENQTTSIQTKPIEFHCWISGEYVQVNSRTYEYCIADLLKTSTNAQTIWEKLDSRERSTKLFTISKELAKSSSTAYLAECFSAYSEWALLAEELRDWKPVGVVLVVLSADPSGFGLASTVPAALASGCSVVVLETNVHSSTETSHAADIVKLCRDLGLPGGLLNVMVGSNLHGALGMLSKSAAKEVVIGQTNVVDEVKPHCLTRQFSFLNLRKTSAIVLDGADIDGTVDKIASETWTNKTESPWAVRTIVVQESIAETFSAKLLQKLQSFGQFTPTVAAKSTASILESISAAQNAGATVWTQAVPNIVFEFQDQSDEDVVSVLTCRTAAEAVTIANTRRFNLACSVWTENSAQAMEVAGKLDVGTVWVNCHGVQSPRVVLQPRGMSGDGHFGGRDGMLDYMYRVAAPSSGEASTSNLPSMNTFKFNQATTIKTVTTAQSAFAKWQGDKKRRHYLFNIAEELSAENLAPSEVVHYWAAQAGKHTVVLEDNTVQDVCVLESRSSRGVVVVYMNRDTITFENFVGVVAPVLAAGCVIIVVTSPLREDMRNQVEAFIKHLPSGVLTLINEPGALKYLAEDPQVNAFWFCNAPSVPEQLLPNLCKWSKHLYPVWVIPEEMPRCTTLFSRQCCRTKAVWIAKLSSFP